MKKVVIGIVIAVLILGLGAGGVLGYGYLNAKTDKAYAQNAKNLVNDFEKKYSDDYLDKQFKDSSKTTAEDLKTAKEAVTNLKKDAESSLANLNSKKSTKRTATIKGDTEDYFNLTIEAADNAMAYLNYSQTLVDAGTSLEAVGGDVNSLADAIVQFETAEKKINDAISTLEKTTPPKGMEDFNKDLIAALEEFSSILGKMTAALKAGDVALLESYSNSLMTSMTKLMALESPSSDEITKNIISSEDQKKLDDYPAKISSEADTILKKTFVF